MGWGRTLLLGDIGNRLDIEATERDINDLKGKLSTSRRTDMSQDALLRVLVDETAELKLYLASVVRLLTAQGSITKDELKAMVDAIDAEDGVVDGKMKGDIV